MRVKRLKRGWRLTLTDTEHTTLLTIIDNGAMEPTDLGLDEAELRAARRLGQWAYAGGPEGAWSGGGPDRPLTTSPTGA